MGSTRRCSTSNNGSKSGASPSVWALLTVLLLILLGCSPCQGRKLLAADHEQGKVMHFEGGLVLRVPSSSGEESATVAATAAPRGFSRADRSMRSVPSPGVGH
uniref:Uncharacterized protein n=1 Tax=Avena sativa TaxID=4498 RepID=A0ACD5T894_AVESA